jgi:hypothetical protein
MYEVLNSRHALIDNQWESVNYVTGSSRNFHLERSKCYRTFKSSNELADLRPTSDEQLKVTESSVPGMPLLVTTGSRWMCHWKVPQNFHLERYNGCRTVVQRNGRRNAHVKSSECIQCALSYDRQRLISSLQPNPFRILFALNVLTSRTTSSVGGRPCYEPGFACFHSFIPFLSACWIAPSSESPWHYVGLHVVLQHVNNRPNQRLASQIPSLNSHDPVGGAQIWIWWNPAGGAWNPGSIKSSYIFLSTVEHEMCPFKRITIKC